VTRHYLHYLLSFTAAGALAIVLAAATSSPIIAQGNDPAGSAVSRLAEALGNYRAADESLDVQSRLRLQLELADAVDAATIVLRHDVSRQGESARAAVAAIRIGLEGEASSLDQAAAIVDALLHAQVPAAASTPQAHVQTDTTSLLESMTQNISALHDAVAAGEADEALQAQGELLNDATLLELIFRYVPTENARRVRSALDDLHVGLAGDPHRLEAAASALEQVAYAEAVR
jgi:hypothetical protein